MTLSLETFDINISDTLANEARTSLVENLMKASIAILETNLKKTQHLRLIAHYLTLVDDAKRLSVPGQAIRGVKYNCSFISKSNFAIQANLQLLQVFPAVHLGLVDLAVPKE